MISKMSLKLGVSWKKIIQWVAIALLIILVLGFFIKVAVWEDHYYREMEGSERAEVSKEEKPEQEELIEVPPTEEEVYEYIVAEDRPRYLTVPSLGIYNSRILPMGINDDGALSTPNNIFDVGWYESSGRPGYGQTMLIDGHNGGPHVHGVFKDLPNLSLGDIITVERGDGAVFNYSVMENVEIPLDEADIYMATAMKSPENGKESITLISCSGEWSDSRYTYLSRQFVRAVLVS